MRGYQTAVLIALALGGCNRARPAFDLPAKAYFHWQDRFIASTGIPLPGRPYPCSRVRKESVDGHTIEIVEDLSTVECFHFAPPKRWRGYWRNEFEGSQFCPDDPATCTFARRPRIWLDYDEKLRPSEGMYAVDFIGRQTLYGGGYGHFGMSDQEMVVERMISIRRLDEVIVG